MDIYKPYAVCLTTNPTGLNFMECGDRNVQHSASSYFML